MFRFVLALAAVLLCATTALSAPAAVISRSSAIQFGGQQMLVRSPSLQRDFLIEVMPPHSPKLYPAHTFPVIYALDGGYGVAGAAGRNLAASGAMASAYVVSVGYPPEDYGRRMHDLMHRPTTFMGRNEGGGAEAFERFLIDELRPLIEAEHAVDHRRAIYVGYSGSGLFGANLLARRPGAFSAYVLGSPSFWLEPEAKARVAAAQGTGERVLVSVGGKEESRMRDDAEWLAGALAKHFRPEFRVYPGANHNSFYLRMVMDALPVLLPTLQDPSAPPNHLLSDAEAQSYLGTWRLQDGRALTFRLIDGFLWVELPGGAWASLITETPGRFYSLGFDLALAFEGRRLTVRAPGATFAGERAD